MRVKNENVKDIAKEINKKKSSLSTKEPKTKFKPTWEVVMEDRVDFIVRKKMARTAKVFVFLYSKKLFYIYDEATDKLEEVNDTSITTFFNGIDDSFVISLKNGDIFFKKGKKESKDTICNAVRLCNGEDLIKDNRTIKPIDELYELILSEMISFDAINDWLCGYNYGRDRLNDMAVMWKASRKTCIHIKNRMAEYSKMYSAYAYQNIRNMYWNNIKRFYDFAGTDNLKKVIDNPFICSKLFIERNQVSSTFLDKLRSWDIDPTRFVNYILGDLFPKQLSDLSEYEDTLNLEASLYGKIKDKYPKNIEVLHDVLVRANEEKRNCSTFKDAFRNKIEDLEINYSYTGDTYKIVVPTDPQELVDEGTELSHCVAEYVEKVINGDCVVVFLRRRKKINESLFTIEIIGDEITQIEGYQRSITVSKGMYEFIQNFAKNKGLKISAFVNVVEDLAEEKAKVEKERKREEKKKLKEMAATETLSATA